MITNSNLLKKKTTKHSEAKFLFSAANIAILGDMYDN